MYVRVLTRASLDHVRVLCFKHIYPGQGDIIRLIDPMTNEVLVDPRLGIRVRTADLALALFDINLTDGRVHFSS